MIDFRPILHVVGAVLMGLALMLLLPLSVDLFAHEGRWPVFVQSLGITGFVGAGLWMGTAGPMDMTVRQTHLTVGIGWVAACLFAALPFAIALPELSGIDAVFEATAGLTTTAATVLTDLDHLPHGLLIWRALLQWVGGLAFIMMAITVLPGLAVGGMQIFRIELPSAPERAAARLKRMGGHIAAMYAVLTAFAAIALWLAGMGRFDAVMHAMTMISCGGFSGSGSSLGHFNQGAVEVVGMVIMLIAGLPFLGLMRPGQGDWRFLVRDQQVHWYFALLAASGLALALWLWAGKNMAPLDGLRHGLLIAVSVMTGTGLQGLDYGGWDGLPAVIVFLLTFVGGCAGSAAAGMKVFRFQLLFSNVVMQIRQILRPHAVMAPKYNNRHISEEVLGSVMGYLFVYVLAFAVLAMLLSFVGVDFLTALSGAASALANLGPGLGDVIGPGGSHATLPDEAKALLSMGMLFGRLEMFTFLVLFVPHFWRH